MMIMGRSVSNGVPIAMLCYPSAETGDKIKFVLAEGFRQENGEPEWDSAKEFGDLNSALQAWFNHERTGLRSLASVVAV